MPRKLRSAKLETRSARSKIPVAKKATFVPVGVGLALGYRRNKNGNGIWCVRCSDGHGGNWVKKFGEADDHEPANTEAGVFDFWRAIERAKAIARGTDGAGERPLTFAEAIDQYERDLAARGGQAVNATCLRTLLPANLLAKPVALLTAVELRHWRDGLLERGLQPASVVRYCKRASASLNLAARVDERIASPRPWKVGLASIPGSRRARNVVLDADMVHKIVAACYAFDASFGLLIELLATCGARPSQASRLLVGDVQADRVMMPRSLKGTGIKRIDRRPMPLPASLIGKLRIAAGNRVPDEPLLRRSDGRSWRATDINRHFARALAVAKLPKATPYSLRHSSITRQLLRATPVRVCADFHDTSVREIEATYGHLIADHADALLRETLIDFGKPATDNVVRPPRS